MTDWQALIMCHMLTKPGMLRNLSTEESFKDVSFWKLAHACQGHFPVISEPSQLITDHVDCEQILKVEHLAINFAYLVMLIKQQQDLPSFQKQSLGGAFFHQDVDLSGELTNMILVSAAASFASKVWKGALLYRCAKFAPGCSTSVIHLNPWSGSPEAPATSLRRAIFPRPEACNGGHRQ